MTRGWRCAVGVLGITAMVTTSCGRSAQQEESATTAVPTSTSAAMFTPLLARVVSPPVPVPGTDGKYHLAYELQLTNVLSQDMTLNSVSAIAADTSVLSLTGDQLRYWTRVIGTAGPTTRIGAGQSALVWLDVPIARPSNGEPARLPDHLVHQIGISVEAPNPPLVPGPMTETVAPVSVQPRRPAVIKPPLRGPNWLDGNGCCHMTPHRMAVNPIDGQLWAAERFAIDYVQLDSAGRLFTGPRNELTSYPYYGADIHAVADGAVISAVDGLPEQIADANPAGLPLDQYAGNHIVQDIGDGNYALYAHLATGSVDVAPGDRLTSGQVIGRLGNTGNTDAPHLHFHVMSEPDPLRSDGLPFVFDSFDLDARLASPEALDNLFDDEPAPRQPGFSARAETAVSPMFLDVMTYADR